MRKFILLLFLMISINGMAFPIHHFHHYSHHSSHVTHRNNITTRTRSIQPQRVRPVMKRHHTKMVNTYWRNGILYYVILRPKKGHVYDNGLVLCKGCNKVLVKKGVKYCSKCRKLKKLKR